jgi:predicted secreted protein
MKKRVLVAALAALCLVLPLSAGDVASFVNLGFSKDSAYFMFGQYGAELSSGQPWAELYLVDTKKNDFVPGGALRRVFDGRIEAGQEGGGALFSLYGENVALVRKYGVDHLLPGRVLYVLLDGAEAPELLSFRDFKTGTNYEIVLRKSLTEGKEGATSSFGLSITATAADGVQKRVDAGNPAIRRKDVKDYLIRRVLLAPDNRSLVLIIEKLMSVKGDASVRSMVETLRLP